MSAGRLLTVTLWAAAAAITFSTARREPSFALARSPALLAAEIAASGVVVLVALRTSPALVIPATLWLVAEWPTPGAPDAVAFTFGLVGAAAVPAAVAHVSAGHLRRPDVLALYVGSVGLLGLAPTMLSDPRAEGCGVCPTNLLSVADHPVLASDLMRVGLGVTALAAVASAATFGWRRRIGPAFFMIVSAAGLVHAWSRGFASNDTAERTLRGVAAFGLLLLAAERVWPRLVARRAQARLAREVVEVATSMRPGGVRALLADALDDPGLEVLHPHRDGWIDATGAAREPDPAATRLVVDEVVLAAVRTTGDVDRVHDVGRVARIAVVHEALQARLRAELAELRRSRADTVAAADAERRRLERDLHDGAQQGLASLAMALGLDRSANAAEARAAVLAALERLRELAHGIYPPSLAEAGLPAALEVLAEWRPQLTVRAVPERRLDPQVEASAYFLTDAYARDGERSIEFRAHERMGALHIELVLADPRALPDAEDRIGALGGSVTIEHNRVHAVLPCG